MPYKVLVLDNSLQKAKAMANAVRTWDKNAQPIEVHTADEAISAVKDHEREFRYAIVDLFLDLTPNGGQITNKKRTNVFLDWLRGQNLFGVISVLVVSQEISILNALDSGIAGHVKTYERESSARAESVAIKKFIDGLPGTSQG